MDFTEKNDYYESTNKKQHINLSPLASEVMGYDMFSFKENSKSGFINRIFEKYYFMADASISLALRRVRNELSLLLSDIPEDAKKRNQIMERLLDEEKRRLIDKASSYSHGTGFKFWLNTKNFEYLTEENGECTEDAYYSTRGKYIKSVLEEYARLPYVERERIYFSDTFVIIDNAIKGTDPQNPHFRKTSYQLHVVTDSETEYSVYPYQILCDPLSTANYLVGYSKRYNMPEEEKTPCSFRISALKKIKEEKSKSAFLKEKEKAFLDQCIASRGVQFLVGEQDEIKIRLTKAGINKYHRQAHLRPPISKGPEDDVYITLCTQAQAEFYFFKFGPDAEILSPPDLRAKFISTYEAALRSYSSKNPDDQQNT